MPSMDKKPIEVNTGEIKVKALRAGFYKRRRINTGDEFVIEGKHQLGKWMEII